MLRIAIQAKGRLNEDSVRLLTEAGIRTEESKRKLLTHAFDYPLEVLYLRDDDIPQTVAAGVADIGIVGLNETEETGEEVDILSRLGFGKCRLSLAVPRSEDYQGLEWFQGRRVATSYPGILRRFFSEKGIDAEIHDIAGSVEIAPAVGMADCIFDIVSSGGTLISNGLKEVETVLQSEAVLIATKGIMDAPSGGEMEQKRRLIEEIVFRFEAVKRSRGMKYMLMNLPEDRIDDVVAIMPGMKSPTVLPLAQKGWCSVHAVVQDTGMWDKIRQLKEIGATDILILSLEQMIP